MTHVEDDLSTWSTSNLVSEYGSQVAEMRDAWRADDDEAARVAEAFAGRLHEEIVRRAGE